MIFSTGWRWLATTVAFALVAVSLGQHPAWAAGGAYQVDTSEVSDEFKCKVESWISWASNHDFFAASTPSCSMPAGRPLELSAQFSRARGDGEWGTGVIPKAKMNLLPSGIGIFGLAVSAQAGFDLLSGENTSVAATVPLTMRLSDVMRINVNAGVLWDRTLGKTFATYGFGFDWRTPDNVWTWTAEIFGQGGAFEFDGPESVIRPRFQTGIRYRPIDPFSIDVIYGRNLNGENANWITIATIYRFPGPEK